MSHKKPRGGGAGDLGGLGGRLRRPAVQAAALIGIALVAYFPALRCGYVWDDDRFVVKNPLIHASDGLRRFWFTHEAPDYFPLTSSMLWIEWRLWGGSGGGAVFSSDGGAAAPASAQPTAPASSRSQPAGAFGFHLVSILLHAVSAILLWRILLGLGAPGAWLAALLFVLHPVNVESVAWITERKNTLSMALFLSSLLAFMRFEDHGGRGRYILSLVCFLLALLSKTSVVTLPVVLLGVAWWRRGRIARADLLRSIPFFALAMALGLLTVWFQYTVNIATDVVRDDGLLSRAAIAGKAVWFYLYKALLPMNLMFVYPRWETGRVTALSFFPWILLAAAFALFVWKRRAWGRPLLAGAGYFVLTLFPVLGFLDIYFMRYSLVADHWQYVSLPGLLALAAGLGIRAAVRTGRRAQTAGLAVASLVCLLFLVQSWTLQREYSNEETLWRSTLEKNPSAFIAHNNLGPFLERRGRPDEALEYYLEATRINPHYKEAWANAGSMLHTLGQYEQAVVFFERSLALDDRNPKTHTNFGNTLSKLGRVEEALAEYERAIGLAPGYADAYFNMAATLNDLGKHDEAAKMCEKALAIDPGNVEALNNLAAALARRGEIEVALRYYRRALDLQPRNPVVLFNVGYALQIQGDYASAADHLRQALSLNPNLLPARLSLAESLSGLGRCAEAAAEFRRVLAGLPQEADATRGLAWILATAPDESVRDGAEALRLAESLSQLQGGSDYRVLDVLAAAHAESGRFDEAARTAGKALDLARKAGRSEETDAIAARVAAYERREPYRSRPSPRRHPQ